MTIVVVNTYITISVGGYTALRIRTLSNGGSHRVTLCEIDFLSGGSEISKTSTTAFEGGTGSVGNAISGAFDDNTASRWSRVSTGGTCFGGLMGYPSSVTPDQIRVTTADWGGANAEAPVDFVVEGSTNTTTGTDGSWTQIGAQQFKNDWTSAQQTITFTL